MNSLDSLFDFAALMSTSSAMTLAPDTNNASETLPQTASTQIPGGQIDESQQPLQHTLSELDEAPLSTHELAFIGASTAHADDMGESAPGLVPVHQQACNPQHQTLGYMNTTPQNFTPLTASNHENTRGYHHTQLPTWGFHHHHHHQQPCAQQYFQQVPDLQMQWHHIYNDHPCLPPSTHQLFPALGYNDNVTGSISPIRGSHQHMTGDGLTPAFQNQNHSYASTYRSETQRHHLA